MLQRNPALLGMAYGALVMTLDINPAVAIMILVFVGLYVWRALPDLGADE